jgi:hypothetical protein
MFKLDSSLLAWNTDSFVQTFKKEVCSLKTGQLPLQQCLSNSSYALDDKLSITILNVTNDDRYISVKAGIFFTGIIAGCNCADDPGPVDEINEYCEMLFSINRKNAETDVSIVS